jgi:hypothetical protein
MIPVINWEPTSHILNIKIGRERTKRAFVPQDQGVSLMAFYGVCGYISKMYCQTCAELRNVWEQSANRYRELMELARDAAGADVELVLGLAENIRQAATQAHRDMVGHLKANHWPAERPVCQRQN